MKNKSNLYNFIWTLKCYSMYYYIFHFSIVNRRELINNMFIVGLKDWTYEFKQHLEY